MPFGIGATEMIILLVVILVVFGPKRLPEMGRSLGKGMREFKDSISGKNDDDDERDEPVQRAIGTQDTIVPEAPREQRETERIP
jgi:sec-independent protein translocase protein TatA